MAWTIDYTDTAKGQLRKLDKQSARRIVDYMDERITGLDNPRSMGRVTGLAAQCVQQGNTQVFSCGALT